eukprot:767418-Hanusia_phi.AAC.2
MFTRVLINKHVLCSHEDMWFHPSYKVVTMRYALLQGDDVCIRIEAEEEAQTKAVLESFRQRDIPVRETDALFDDAACDYIKFYDAVYRIDNVHK